VASAFPQPHVPLLAFLTRNPQNMGLLIASRIQRRVHSAVCVLAFDCPPGGWLAPPAVAFAGGIEKEVWVDCYSDPLGWDDDCAAAAAKHKGPSTHLARDPGTPHSPLAPHTRTSGSHMRATVSQTASSPRCARPRRTVRLCSSHIVSCVSCVCRVRRVCVVCVNLPCGR
jgi:hypothetical protein